MHPLQQLLEEFQAAKAETDPLPAALSKIRQAMRDLYERNRPDERHIHNDADLPTLFPRLIESLYEKRDLQTYARQLWQESQRLGEQVNTARQRLQVARDALERETTAHAQRFSQSFSSRAEALRQRIADLLAPYCSTRQQALALAGLCEGTDGPMGLDLKAAAWNARHGDVESRAQKVLSALSQESAPAERAPAPAGA